MVTFNTTYPYHCPYIFPLSIFDILEESEFNLYPDKMYWIPVRRYHRHLLYRSDEVEFRHRFLFHYEEDYLKDCMVINTAIPAAETVNCEDTHEALCIYDSTRKPIFCERNPQLCDCQGSHDSLCNIIEVDDSKLQEDVFIQLLYNYRSNAIRILIKNHSSLVLLREGTLIHCYADAPKVSLVITLYKYPSELFTKFEFDEYVVYEIVPKTRSSHWCVGYKYPNLEPIVSETIIAGPLEYRELVMNLTIRRWHHPQEISLQFEDFIQAYYPPMFMYLIDVKQQSVENHLEFNFIYHFTAPEHIIWLYMVIYRFMDFFNSTIEEVVRFNLLHCDLCSSVITTFNGTEIDWPSTYVGQTVIPTNLYLLTNNSVLTRTCIGDFRYGAHWSNQINVMNVTMEQSEITEDLIQLLSSCDDASELNNNLNKVLSNANEGAPIDVYLVAMILAKVAFSRQIFTVNTFLENMNSVMNFAVENLNVAQNELNATDMLLYNLDVALSTSHDMKGERILEYTNDIVTQVIDIRKTNVRGFAIYEINKEMVFRNLTNATESVEDVDFENLKLAILIPPKLFRQILEDLSWSEEIQLVTTVFANDVLFNCNCTEQSTGFVGSIFVKDFFPSYFEEPLQIIYESIPGAPERSPCGYWNYGMDRNSVAIQGRWYEDDTISVKPTYTLCNHWHMTHFALLMAAPVSKTLNIITIIGCVLSFCGISAILMTNLVSKEWREVPGNKILINFSTSIMMQMIFLFVSNFINEKSNRHMCAFIGFSLHYIVLCQFSWMMIISYLQHNRLVHSLAPEPKHIVLKSCAFAWLTPLLIALFTCTNGFDVYLNNCYLSSYGLYLGLFLPVCIAIGVNMFLFGNIVRALSCGNSPGHGAKMTLHKIKVFTILLFLMGFSWTFGVLAGVLNSMALSYLFCIISTLQGVVIFITFVLFNKKSRQIWQKKLRNVKLFSSILEEDKEKESKCSYA